MKCLYPLLSFLALLNCITSFGQKEYLDAYPNPFTQQLKFTIRNESLSPLTLQLFDMSGNQILTIHENAPLPLLTDTTLNFDTLQDGVYFALLEGKQKSVIKLFKSPSLATPQLNSHKLSIQPNPVSDQLTLIGTVPNQEVYILNYNGQFVSKAQLHNNQLSVSDIPQGAYYLQLFLPQNELYFFVKE